MPSANDKYVNELVETGMVRVRNKLRKSRKVYISTFLLFYFVGMCIYYCIFNIKWYRQHFGKKAKQQKNKLSI